MSSNNINTTPDSLTLAKGGRRKRKSSNHGETFRSPSKSRNYNNEDQDPESDTNKNNKNNNTTIDNNKSMSYDEDDNDEESSVVQQSYESDYFGNDYDDDDDDDGANNDSDNSEKDDDSEISVDVDMKPQSLVQTKILNLEILCHQAIHSHKKDAYYYFDELETRTDFIKNIRKKTSTNLMKILNIVTLIQMYCYAPISQNSQHTTTTSSKEKKDIKRPLQSEEPPLETLKEHDWIEAIDLLTELRDSISGFVVDLTDELLGVQYHEILEKLNVQRALSILREAVAMKRGQGGGQSKYLDSNVLQKYNTCIFGNIKNKELIEQSLNIGLYIKSKRSSSSSSPKKSPAKNATTTPTKKTTPIRISIKEVTSFLRDLVKENNDDDNISLKQFQESFYEYLRDCYDVIPKSKLDKILLMGGNNNMKNDCPFISTTITPEMIHSSGDTQDDNYDEQQHTTHEGEDIQEEQEQIQFNDDTHEDEENQSDSDSNYNNGSEEEEEDENDHTNDNNTMISIMNKKKRKRRQKTKASTNAKVSAKAKSSKSLVSSKHKHKHNNKANNDDDDDDDNESKTSSVSQDQDSLSNHISSDDDDDDEEEGNNTQGDQHPSSQVTATPPPNKKTRKTNNNNNDRESLTSNSSGKKSISNSTNNSSKKKKKKTISTTRHSQENEDSDRQRTRTMATKKNNKNSGGRPIGGQQLQFEDSDDDDNDDNDSEVTDPSPTKHLPSSSSLPKREKFIRERQRLNKNKNTTTRTTNSSPQGSIISTLSTNNKRRRRFWTQKEKQAVLDGVKNWGVGNWAAIKVEFNDVLASRTAVQIKDCYRTLRKQAEKQEAEAADDDDDQYIE